MIYEVTKCDKCGSRVSNMDALLQEDVLNLMVLAEKQVIAPLGYELYDFGCGSVIPPMPDLPGESGTYLTHHIVGVVKSGDTQSKVTCVNVSLHSMTTENLRDALLKAVEASKTQEKQFVLIP